MKKIVTIVACISFLLFLTIACSSSKNTKQYNAYIDKAQANMDKGIALTAQKDNKVNKITAAIKRSNQEAINLITQYIDSTNKANDYFERAIEYIEKAKDLNVNEKTSKYAEMVKRSWNTQLKSSNIFIKGLNQFNQYMQEIERGRNPDKQIVINTMEQADSLHARAVTLEEEAKDYYSRNLAK